MLRPGLYKVRLCGECRYPVGRGPGVGPVGEGFNGRPGVLEDVLTVYPELVRTPTPLF